MNREHKKRGKETRSGPVRPLAQIDHDLKNDSQILDHVIRSLMLLAQTEIGEFLHQLLIYRWRCMESKIQFYEYVGKLCENPVILKKLQPHTGFTLEELQSIGELSKSLKYLEPMKLSEVLYLDQYLGNRLIPAKGISHAAHGGRGSKGGQTAGRVCFPTSRSIIRKQERLIQALMGKLVNLSGRNEQDHHGSESEEGWTHSQKD